MLKMCKRVRVHVCLRELEMCDGAAVSVSATARVFLCSFRGHICVCMCGYSAYTSGNICIHTCVCKCLKARYRRVHPRGHCLTETQEAAERLFSC